MEFLNNIYRGQSYLDVHQDMDPPLVRNTKEYQDALRTEIQWRDAARNAVLDGFDQYVELFRMGDHGIRMSACWLLKSLESRQADVAELLITAAQTESDADVLRVIIQSAGVIMSRDTARTEVQRFLNEVVDDADWDISIRTVAAIELLSVANDSQCDKLLRFLNQANEENAHAFSVTQKLSHRRDQQATWLEQCLSSQDRECSLDAIQLAVDVCRQSRRVTELLLPRIGSLCKDPRPEVQEDAVDALSTLGRGAITVAAEIDAGLELKIKQTIADRGKGHSLSEVAALHASVQSSVSTGSMDEHIAALNSDSNHNWPVEAIYALGRANGDQAKETLTRVIVNGDKRHRAPAIRAYWDLTQDAERVLDFVREEFAPRSFAFCTEPGYVLLNCLVKMGTAAAPLADRLRELATQDDRLLRIGAMSEFVILDECFVTAIGETLAAIEAT